MATTTLWLGQTSPLFELTGSASWNPVYAWEEENGKRRPSSRQQIDAAGLPVWEIRVIARMDNYGRQEETFMTLRHASASRPDRESLASVGVAA